MSEKKPNIIFITSDQQRADCYGFAGRKFQPPFGQISKNR